LSEKIIKVTSKGQLTIPSTIRREAGIGKGSYVYIKPVGELVIMKKVERLGVKEISALLGEVAKEKGLTKAVLSRDVERVRERLWKERYEKASRGP
jgi:AbrB family looped-hinge helix DNA binding protein